MYFQGQCSETSFLRRFHPPLPGQRNVATFQEPQTEKPQVLVVDAADVELPLGQTPMPPPRCETAIVLLALLSCPAICGLGLPAMVVLMLTPPVLPSRCQHDLVEENAGLPQEVEQHHPYRRTFQS